MKQISLLLMILVSQPIWAVNQNALSISALETQQPVQQFVTSDSTEPSATPETSNSSEVIPKPDTTPPPPTVFTPLQSSPPPNVATALGLSAPRKEKIANPLAGGLDIPSFMQCKQLYTSLCRDQDVQADACIKRITQPNCKPFVAFAKTTSLLAKDDIDFIKHYQQLDLIHVIRFGANYPGVYYSLGADGNLVDLIFGPQTQGLDIRKDLHYPEIVSKYPNVMLFSIVEKLPKVETTEDGKGLRLTFRFQLLNGCHACERAGYANVAYDFSESGALQTSTIVSLEPAF